MRKVTNSYYFIAATLTLYLLGCGAASPSPSTPNFGKALSVNGTTTYVSTPVTTGSFTLPYTFEFHFKLSDVAGSLTLFQMQTSGVSFSVNVNGGKLEPRWPVTGCAGTAGFTGNTSLVADTKYHVAVVIEDNSGGAGPVGTTLYLNGTVDGTSTTATGSCASITGFTVGGAQGGTNLVSGVLDELRYSTSARYTTAFSAPTAPFISDSNTGLLSHWDSNWNTIDSVGSALAIGSPTGTAPTLVASPFP